MEDTLRAIEREVFQDVWISTGRRITVAAAAAVLTTAAVGRLWSAALFQSSSVGTAAVLVFTTAIFLLACLTSMIALRVRRFRGCYSATFTSALASVTGVAAVWWHRTADGPGPLVWTLICAVGVAVLTVTWLSVVLTPLDRSQPDLRVRHTR